MFGGSNDEKHQEKLGSLLQSSDHLAARLKSSSLNSKFVRVLKLALPLIAVAMVVVLLVWSDQTKIAPPLDKKDIVPDQMGQNKLINPRFESVDEKSQPYVITAKEAVQVPELPNIVDLVEPKGSMDFKDGSKVNIESVAGRFDQVKQTLDLNNAVKLTGSDGYIIDLQSIKIDLIGRTSVSTQPVTAAGRDGIVTATGFSADAATGILTFTGPAKLILQQEKPTP